MKKSILLPLSILLSLSLLVPASRGEEKGKRPQGPPPAVVVTSPLREGEIQPVVTLTGTVYFRLVSRVSSEVSGLVSSVHVDEGEDVGKGEVIARLDTELLELELSSLEAQVREKEKELEKARTDLERIENLFREQSVARQTYDDYRYRVETLRETISSLRAQAEKTKKTIEKATVRSPFDGVVISRSVDPGEWVTPGAPVVEVGTRGEYRVIVDVPQSLAGKLRKGTPLPVIVRGRKLSAKVRTYIPRGDERTRTFPLRLDLTTRMNLYEGEEAEVILPAGEKEKVLLIDRNAVVTFQGKSLVFTVKEGKALPLPVEVVGFRGNLAGVRGEGLAPGLPVIVKGNERLRPGQAVTVTGEKGK